MELKRKNLSAMDISNKTETMLDGLIKTAVIAGEKILTIYESTKRKAYIDKEDGSPLTEADTLANNIIVGFLQKEYPEYSILSEETADNLERLNNDFCFLVDPLDGTKEFIKGNGEFTVNIALIEKGSPIIGMIYAPFINKLYYASKGNGAYVKDYNKGEVKRLRVSDRLDNLVWIGSKSHSGKKEEILIEDKRGLIKDIRSAGSSLKGCLVAEGIADVYYRFGLTCEWDTAAMQCIVEEAGGIFRQMDGSPMTYNRENTLNEKGFYIVNRNENIWV